MAVQLAGFVQGGASADNAVDDVASSSWTPGANDLIVAFICGDRPTDGNETTSQVSSVSGNGLTLSRIPISNEYSARKQCWASAWRAMGSSPTAGAVTALLSHLTDSATIIVTRWTGVDTSGTNGSGAIEAQAVGRTSGSDNTAGSVSLTTVTNDAVVVGVFNTRDSNLSSWGSGITHVTSENQETSGGPTHAHVGYKTVASAGSTTLTGTVSATEDWVGIALALKPAASSGVKKDLSARWAVHANWFQTFDGIPAGDTITTENSAGVSGTAPDVVSIASGFTVTADGTVYKEGGRSAKFGLASPEQNAYLEWNTKWGTVSEFFLDFYFRISQVVPDTKYPVSVRHGTTNVTRIRFSTTGTITLQAPTDAVATSTWTMSANQWYRLALHVIHSTTNGVAELRIYDNPDSSTPVETLSGTGLNTGAASDSIRIGSTVNALGAMNIWIDQILRQDDDWPVRVQTVNKALSARWGVRTPVPDALSGRWAVRKAISSPLSARWLVAGSGINVGKALQALWAVGATAGSSLAGRWATRAIARSDRVARWRVDVVIVTVPSPDPLLNPAPPASLPTVVSGRVVTLQGTLSRSHEVVTKVEIIDSGIGTLLDVVSGSVSIDSNSAVRRRATIVIADPKLVPSSAASLLAPVGNKLRLWRGVRHYDGTEELLPLGVFGLASTQISSDGGDLTVTVDAYDSARKISRNRWQHAHIIAAGTNYATAIQFIVQDRLPGTICNFAPTERTTPEVILGETTENDPWKSAKDLADAIGYELYMDTEDICVLKPVPDPVLAPIKHSFEDGQNAMLLSLDRRMNDERTFSGVIATGESTAIAAPVRAEAWDDDPTSPTYYLGDFGRVPYFLASTLLTSEAQALEAAQSRLRIVKGVFEQVQFNAIPHPGLDAGDVVALRHQLTRVQSRYVLDSLTIPLSPAGTMTAECRMVRL